MPYIMTDLIYTGKINVTPMGYIKPANMDANDTYLVINNVTINTNTQSKAAGKLIANIIPKSVAIPFPPLNPANTGNKCPITAAIPSASS